MDLAVETAIRIFSMMRSTEVAENSRAKLGAYLEKLVAGGENDSERLTVHGLTYLREMVEPSRRFSGL